MSISIRTAKDGMSSWGYFSHNSPADRAREVSNPQMMRKVL